MSYAKAVEPFVFATSHEQLLDLAVSEVNTGRALAAIMHGGFALDDCTVITEAVRKTLQYDKNILKTGTGRPSLEYKGRNWLPSMNTSDQAYGQETRLLPTSIVGLALGLHNKTSGNPIKSMPSFYTDEFRSPTSDGVLHTDAWGPDEGLNMILPAVGEGALYVVDAGQYFKPITGNQIFEVFDVDEVPKETGGELHSSPLYAGSIAIISSFGNKQANRRPVPHRVTTTSPFRSSVSLDQLKPTYRQIGSMPRRKAKKLEAAGIDLSAYWEALADAA